MYGSGTQSDPYAGGTRNPSKDPNFEMLAKAQPSGWQQSGWTTSAWNSTPSTTTTLTPSKTSGDALGIGGFNSDGFGQTKLPDPKSSVSTTTTPKTSSSFNSNAFSNFGEALKGAESFQNRNKAADPWSMDNPSFSMEGVGKLMNMVGGMRSLSGG